MGRIFSSVIRGIHVTADLPRTMRNPALLMMEMKYWMMSGLFFTRILNMDSKIKATSSKPLPRRNDQAHLPLTPAHHRGIRLAPIRDNLEGLTPVVATRVLQNPSSLAIENDRLRV